MAYEEGWLITFETTYGGEPRNITALRDAGRQALRRLTDFGVGRLGLSTAPAGSTVIMSVDLDPDLISEDDVDRLPNIVSAVLREVGDQFGTQLTSKGQFVAQ